MKHVSLLSLGSNGKNGWRLIDDNGRPIQAFEAFNDILLKRHPANTRKAYAHAVARFIDYLISAEQSGQNPTRAVIRSLVEAYPDWLMLGRQSGNELAKAMGDKIESPMLARSSADQAIAAVKRFLDLSERFRQKQVEAGMPADSVDAIPLWENMDQPRKLSTKESKAIISKSMLAGVISGGPRLINDWRLPVSPAPQDLFDQDAAFPFDQVVDLISKFKSQRDKALYSLLAASGCRMHEAVQLLIEDIDPAKLSVKLINPATRPSHGSYLSLKPIERDKLAWKGRTSSSTLLLQPFKDMFFLHLAEYLKQEHVDGSGHDFVFQNGKGANLGRPIFLAQPSGRNEGFEKACAKLDLPNSFAPHSLRHMYGTYLVNYFPNSSGGYGLPTEIVQKLMGHQSVATTQRYARHDPLLIGADIAAAFANASAPNGKTALEVKRDILAANLLHVEKLIEQDNQKRLL